MKNRNQEKLYTVEEVSCMFYLPPVYVLMRYRDGSLYGICVDGHDGPQIRFPADTVVKTLKRYGLSDDGIKLVLKYKTIFGLDPDWRVVRRPEKKKGGHHAK